MSLLAMPSQILLLIGLVAAGSAPLAAHVVRDLDMVGIPQVRSLEPLSPRSLVIRDTPNVLGTASLATQFNNDVLFSLALNGQVSVPGSPNLTATCKSCFTTGTATLQSSQFAQKNESLIADITTALEDLAKDPLTFLGDVLDVTFALDFQDVAAHFDVDISFAAAGSISVPLLPPISPLGTSIDGNEIGFIPSIDLVFSVSGEVEATAGFDVKLSNSTSIKIDPIKGEIVSMDLSGVQVSPIPLKFTSGSGCIQIALRFGLKAGLGINILGTGAKIDAGVFVDAPAYKACANFNSSAPCEFDLTQTIFGDAGAFADIAASIDFINFKENPSAVTTFFSTDLPTACLASSTSISLANATSASNVTALQATITAVPFSNSTSIVNATALKATVTASPSGDSTSRSIVQFLNTTSTTAAFNGSPGTYTITSCKSNVAWCPPDLQTPVVITKTAAILTTTTTTVTGPQFTMTNAVVFTSMASPVISTISCAGTASFSTSTSTSVSAAKFAQQSEAIISTFAPSISTSILSPMSTPDTNMAQQSEYIVPNAAVNTFPSTLTTANIVLQSGAVVNSAAASSLVSTPNSISTAANSTSFTTLTTANIVLKSQANSVASQSETIADTLTTATYVLSSYLSSPTPLASAIASIGGMSSTWSSPLNNGSVSSGGNGTGIQFTSSAPRSRREEFNFAALCIGLIGLVALV